ncbi:DUF397 domain-containing protein [Nocardia sp. NPDC058499]|uniref:DUF397 domain-containing protein n=1 Tax=Nocardia sp. NPDC058499 TaxID=3346530 RepID=UPI003649800B
MNTDHDSATWRKSSFSGNSGNCVEVGRYPNGTIGIRDTKQNGRGPVLHLSAGEFAAFLSGVKDGEFG